MKKEKTANRPKYYSEELKIKIIKEVLNGNLSKAEANRLYEIRGKSSILEWTRKYSGEQGYDKRGRPLNSKNMQIKNDKLSAQSRRILELEESLRIEKLKVRLSNTMIDIAEEEYGINIRKKFGARQSKK